MTTERERFAIYAEAIGDAMAICQEEMQIQQDIMRQARECNDKQSYAFGDQRFHALQLANNRIAALLLGEEQTNDANG